MLNFIKNNTIVLVLALVVLYFIGKYLYHQPKFINGENAPDFTLEMANGTPFQLSNLKGNYVLLDFWGSWCGPCVKEAPDLKRLYTAFHGKNFTDAKGFEIVSVGIETDKSRWLSAIDRLGLAWQYHVSDFKNMEQKLNWFKERM